MLKYGVISTSQLVRDCICWDHLYMSGRLHKPMQFISSSLDALAFEERDFIIDRHSDSHGSHAAAVPESAQSSLTQLHDRITSYMEELERERMEHNKHYLLLLLRPFKYKTRRAVVRQTKWDDVVPIHYALYINWHYAVHVALLLMLSEPQVQYIQYIYVHVKLFLCVQSIFFLIYISPMNA